MFKKVTQILTLSLCMMAMIPMLQVSAQEKSKTVNSQAEFKEALADDTITTIVLGKDIETTEKINIMRPVTIDGRGHTMKYVGKFGSSQSSDNTVWGGIYVLQVYKTEATIRNIKLTGGNGGLLVNGGKVKLEGTIDVSGNGFGGIELGQGSGVDSVAHIILTDDTKLVNTTESPDKPTLWVPKDSTGSILEVNGVKQELQPLEELTIQEMETLFTPAENPETSDSIISYIILGIISICTFLFASKKVIREK